MFAAVSSPANTSVIALPITSASVNPESGSSRAATSASIRLEGRWRSDGSASSRSRVCATKPATRSPIRAIVRSASRSAGSRNHFQ